MNKTNKEIDFGEIIGLRWDQLLKHMESTQVGYSGIGRNSSLRNALGSVAEGPRQSSEMEMALDRLEASISRSEATFARLKTRLSAVVVERPTQENKETNPGSMSQLAQAIDIHTNRINQLAKDISYVEECVQL